MREERKQKKEEQQKNIKKILDEKKFLLEKLEEVRLEKESLMERYITFMKMAQEIIEDEMRHREKIKRERDEAEYDKDYYAKELRDVEETEP